METSYNVYVVLLSLFAMAAILFIVYTVIKESEYPRWKQIYYFVHRQKNSDPYKSGEIDDTDIVLQLEYQYDLTHFEAREALNADEQWFKENVR